MNRHLRFLRRLVMLTQLGFSMAVPLLICIISCRWLQSRYQLGAWIMLLGIALGIGGAISGVWHSIRPFLDESREKEDPPPHAFNDHH